MEDYFVQKGECGYDFGKDDYLLVCPCSPAGLERVCGSWCAQFRISIGSASCTVFQGCCNLTTQVAVEDSNDCTEEV